jgi:hypothetical protein
MPVWTDSIVLSRAVSSLFSLESLELLTNQPVSGQSLVRFEDEFPPQWNGIAMVWVFDSGETGVYVYSHGTWYKFRHTRIFLMV